MKLYFVYNFWPILVILQRHVKGKIIEYNLSDGWVSNQFSLDFFVQNLFLLRIFARHLPLGLKYILFQIIAFVWWQLFECVEFLSSRVGANKMYYNTEL